MFGSFAIIVLLENATLKKNARWQAAKTVLGFQHTAVEATYGPNFSSNSFSSDF